MSMSPSPPLSRRSAFVAAVSGDLLTSGSAYRARSRSSEAARSSPVASARRWAARVSRMRGPRGAGSVRRPW